MSGKDGPTINLERASVMVIDSSSPGLAILTQIFNGFGARTIYRCNSAESAREEIVRAEIDLIVTDSDLAGPTDGYGFVSWLRRANLGSNTFAPVIMVSGHTRRRNVATARDCGANFIIAKPISPAVVLERVLWVAREARQFVRSESYCGPDRRFKNEGPPGGIAPRRYDDPKPDVLGASGYATSDQDRHAP